MVIIMANKANSLAHTKWMCKYHIIFTPKYRRKVIYNQYRKDLGEILRELCRYKHVEIIEGHLMRDHVHMLVMIPPSLSVSAFMGYLKGKLSIPRWRSHPIHENRATESICTEPCNPLLRATKSMKRATSTY